MPSKKEKQQQQQQALNNLKAQTTPLANSTNTVSTPLTNSYHSVTTNHYTTTTTKKTNLTNESSNGVDHLSLMRDQKHELDGLNNRFSTYVLALRQKSKENDDLQKKVDAEKQKKKSLDNRDNNDLEGQMDELRTDIDESAVLTEHFIRKRNRALKELAFLKEKIRNEEELSYANRRQALETEHQQMLLQLKDLSRRFGDLEKNAQANKAEKDQMEDLYKKLEDELHDLVMNNMRLECNLRTIEEKILLTKAIYETEKNELANEQIKQQQFYTVELDNAIMDIKHDFQTLLKNNKVILENAYTERIEQVKTQISTYQASKPQETTSTSRVSIETLHDELKQAEKARDKIENEYRPLVDLYVSKQKENSQIDEERVRLDGEYSRLLSEINQVTEAIEVGKQYWFSVHFELETYRRLLDLEATKVTVSSSTSSSSSNNTTGANHVTNTSAATSSIVNGKEESAVVVEEPRSIITVKKTESQRAISKTGKFDIDQVQAGFISINNAATNCVDQPLKGWTLVRSVNDGPESTFQFPDSYVLKARTRVRVYSSKADNAGTSAIVQGRLVASEIPTWASTGQGDNVKISLLDDKAINRAQYSETWQ